MKLYFALVLVLLSFAFVNGQETAPSAAETVDQIKLRLLDLQAREEEIK